MACSDIPTPAECRPVIAGLGGGDPIPRVMPGSDFFRVSKSDGLVITGSTNPVPVAGWTHAMVVPEGPFMVRAIASAFTEVELTPGHMSIYAQVPVSAASRTANVVTLTVPEGHGIPVGARFLLNLSDDTFDVVADAGVAPNIASAPTPTTLTFPQTAADDPNGGTGIIAIRCGVTGSVTRNGLAVAEARLPNELWNPTPGVPVTFAPYIRTDDANSDFNLNAANLGAFGNGNNIIVMSGSGT